MGQDQRRTYSYRSEGGNKLSLSGWISITTTEIYRQIGEVAERVATEATTEAEARGPLGGR